MSDVINTVKKTVERYNMLSPGDGVVVGVSGGPDSACLLHVLNEIKDEYNIRLYAAHINHQLRGQAAEQDAVYVESLCATLGVPFFVTNQDVKKISEEKGISEEAAGREVRYAFFFETARRVGAEKVAVAHNMNDQAETILMRFIRGAGLEGLTGIKPFREDGVIRPLLEVERGWIEEYCLRNCLNPRLDQTNLEAIYTRNKLRLDLIPRIIEDHNPNFVHTAVKNAELIRQDNQFIEQYVDRLLDGKIGRDSNGIYIPVDFLINENPSVQRRLIRKAINVYKGNTTDIEYKHVEEILQLAGNAAEVIGTRRALDLPGNVRMEMIYDRIYFTSKIKTDKKDNFIYSLQVGNSVFIKEVNMIVSTRVVDKGEFERIEFGKFTKAFDYNKVNEEIYIRNRLPGDKFTPLGMTGTKKLKDFFIDLKIPKHKRDNIPLVVTGHDIIWVVGMRINEKYKYTHTMDNALIIEFQEV